MATLIGFAGRFWWIFELASHFRVQYGIALGSAALLLLILRQQRWAALFGMCALLNLVVIAPAFWNDAPPASTPNNGQPILRAFLANINSNNRDHARIWQTITEYHPDFVVLLETTPQLLKQLTHLTSQYPYRIASPREDNFGIALFSRHPFLQANTLYLGSPDFPSIAAEFVSGGRHCSVLGTHPPPPVSAQSTQERNAQLRQLASFARQSTQPLLLLGDLNTSPWSPYFDPLLADSGLHDSRLGRGILPSWPAGWPLLWIPIDHALFSNGIQVWRLAIGPDIGSDHYPVIVDFSVTGS
ncbi:MAG: endonuclease/exonuclease/phosphatase family protein [Candidatus Competibacteraceae bacterium]